MRVALICLLLLTSFCCSTKRGRPKPSPECRPLFIFDQVVHYYIDIEAKKVSQLWDAKFTASGDPQLAALVADGLPNGLHDSLALNGSEKIGFKKVDLSDSRVQLIANIFCVSGPHRNAVKVNNCIPIWRDILVFKNENTIVGITKICFSCGQVTMTGTAEHVDFDRFSGYETLAKALNRPRHNM